MLAKDVMLLGGQGAIGHIPSVIRRLAPANDRQAPG
jgi:hypothetical protein